MNDSTLIIRLSQDLHNSLKKKADSMNISSSALVRILITNYCKERDYEYDTRSD